MLIDEAVNIVKDETDYFSEASTEHLKTSLLDVDKFIRVNQLKEITNPVFFNGPTPTEDGLLSNEIFGITKAERSGIYAYIDLGGSFFHPLVYKTLCKLNNKISDIKMFINFNKKSDFKNRSITSIITFNCCE